MTALFIEVGLKSSLLLLAVAAVHALMYRRTSAATRHLVWMLAVIGLLLLPVLSTGLPKWTVAIRVASMKAPDVAALEPSTAQTDARGTLPARDMPAGDVPVDPLAAIAAADASPATMAGAVAWVAVLPLLIAVLPMVYALGVLLFLSRLAVDRWIAQRLVRDATEVSDPDWTRLLADCARRVGVQRPVRLLRSREHTMPLAMGLRVPIILVPAVADTWDDDRRRAVLLHELAHVVRHDCLSQILSALACALYWVHPGAWWVARRLRAERELASDDRALAAGAHPRDYAGHLLELAYTCSGYRAPALVVSMASSRSLEGRMLAILDPARNRTTPTLRGSLASVGIATALLVPVAAASAVAVPATEGGELASPATSEDGRAGDAGVEASQRETANPVERNQVPGTWEIRRADETGMVYVRLAENRHSSSGFTMPLSRLDGLPPALLSGAGGAAQFTLRREAGNFNFEGTFRSGVGAGTYTFAPSESFRAELVKRGFAPPTTEDQYALARSDIGVAFVDELAKQGYTRPDLPQLRRAADHGVTVDVLRELGALGYQLGSVEALVRLTDHGVDPQYIRELRAEGFTGLTTDELLRARDHGVDPEYIRELRDLGYAQLSLDTLIRVRDHGVDPEYVRGLRTLGHRLTLEDLVKTRDHGVDPEYIKALRDLGYPQMTVETLVRARDHGVDAEYIRALAALGYERVPLDSLIRLRDHGVTPEFVQDLKRRGRDRLTVDELIRLRDGNMASPNLHAVNLYAALKAAIERWWND
ncbi:MAG TPA: M56 family metallopeptidase [Vicinamibacterales bacterium]|nr:M56 family metallopeptidase [Vicinamibacterales bacterium]